MAKFEIKIKGDFDIVLNRICNGMLNSSLTSTLDDEFTDFIIDDVRCSVRVFERYSITGNNRVSLNLTLLQKGDSEIYLSAITSGGGEGVFKYNTFGEEAFLNKIKEIIDQ